MLEGQHKALWKGGGGGSMETTSIQAEGNQKGFLISQSTTRERIANFKNTSGKSLQVGTRACNGSKPLALF